MIAGSPRPVLLAISPRPADDRQGEFVSGLPRSDHFCGQVTEIVTSVTGGLNALGAAGAELTAQDFKSAIHPAI